MAPESCLHMGRNGRGTSGHAVPACPKQTRWATSWAHMRRSCGRKLVLTKGSMTLQMMGHQNKEAKHP
eukprot:1161561-Pelagomonas_calceolata.AAC.6